MTEITIGIVFGGSSPEHNESIRATRILYKNAIRGQLERKYKFKYFYLTRSNRWASSKYSKAVLHNREESDSESNYDRIPNLKKCDVLYNTMMGPCGENGNIMGLADLLGVPIIGCGILASALALDKKLSKIIAKSLGIPIVDALYVDKDDDYKEIAEEVQEKIGFPCFVKPNNLGTCAHVFRANNLSEFKKKWRETVRENRYGRKYLIEKFIPNVEVRVFIYEGIDGELYTNDQYNTTLDETALERGGGLFDHVKNRFPHVIRETIADYAKKIFRTFGMKDYARIDFFVEEDDRTIYFNEANTQPFIGSYNIGLMEEDGYTYAQFIKLMVRKNLRTD